MSAKRKAKKRTVTVWLFARHRKGYVGRTRRDCNVCRRIREHIAARALAEIGGEK